MPRILFLTGKLAEPSLRRVLAGLAGGGLRVHRRRVADHGGGAGDDAMDRPAFHAASPVDRVVLPGLCNGELDLFGSMGHRHIEKGPADLLDLPDYFGSTTRRRADYGEHDIEILAGDQPCAALRLSEFLGRRRKARADGADVIDLGCDPGTRWGGVAEAVKTLRGEGLRVSLDSFDEWRRRRRPRRGRSWS